MGRHLPDALRFQVLARDKSTCHYCGAQKGDEGVRLEVDHLTPVSEGGTDDIANLVTACRTCNRGKGTSTLASTPRPTKNEIRLWHKANGVSNGKTAAHFGLAVETIRCMMARRGVREETPVDDGESFDEGDELTEPPPEITGDLDDVAGNLRRGIRLRAAEFANPRSLYAKSQQQMMITLAIATDKLALAAEATKNEAAKVEEESELDRALRTALDR